MIDKKEFEEALKSLSEEKKALANSILDDLIYIEHNLCILRTKPFIKYHPTKPNLSKTTPEAKVYKDLLSQKNNLIRTLNNTLRNVTGEDDKDPMEEFNKKLEEKFGV